MYSPDYNPIDGIIFEDFARSRERLSVDHRTHVSVPNRKVWYMGGHHRATERVLQGHPTRADERLKKF